jgi:hypothetical protein
MMNMHTQKKKKKKKSVYIYVFGKTIFTIFKWHSFCNVSQIFKFLQYPLPQSTTRVEMFPFRDPK